VISPLKSSECCKQMGLSRCFMPSVCVQPETWRQWATGYGVPCISLHQIKMDRDGANLRSVWTLKDRSARVPSLCRFTGAPKTECLPASLTSTTMKAVTESKDSPVDFEERGIPEDLKENRCQISRGTVRIPSPKPTTP